MYEKKLQSKLNRYAWYDHSAAWRTNALVLLAIARDLRGEEPSLFDEAIRTHAKWIEEDKNYTKQHNHGIMQDIALLVAGYWLHEESYITLAVERFIQQLKFAFPFKAAHAENSSGYNAAILRYVFAYSDFLSIIKNARASEVDSYKEGACLFLTFLAMPNTLFPPTGDTFRSASEKRTNTLLPLLKKYESGVVNSQSGLLYAISPNNRNEKFKPSDTTKVFREDGYAFIKSGYEDDDTWIMLKSGYNSTTHKHKDDVSINLYAKGKEVFIDPGMYNYMVGNVLHDYLNSAFAHNTIIIDNASYPMGKNTQNKAGIIEAPTLGVEATVICAYNNHYPGVHIDRKIIYASENEFFIVDDIFSEDIHEYTQNFHLSNDVELISKDCKRTILKINDEWLLSINQLESIEKVTTKFGETNCIKTMSVASTGANSVVPTTSIQFNKTGCTTKFITQIVFHKNEDSETLFSSYDDDTLFIGDISVNISPRQRTLPVPIKVNKSENDKLQIVLPEQYSLSSAFYLFDDRTGTLLHRSGYDNINLHSISIPKPGEYFIRAYVRSADYETCIYSAGRFKVDNKQEIVYEPTPINKCIPFAANRKQWRNSGCKHHFHLETPIFWNGVSVSWYIYKNGASYDYIKGACKLNYEFTEPGLYAVIYRVNVKHFGEIEYGNFPEIVISEGRGLMRNALRLVTRAYRKIRKDVFKWQA